MKKIIALLMVIVIVIVGIVIYIISKTGNNDSSTTNSTTNSSISANTDSITTNVTTSSATAQDKPAETRTDSIGKWTYNIPSSFKDVKLDAPWYEKTYSDDQKTTLYISYHEPQDTDNRNDEQIFSEGSPNIKSGLKQTYGDGKFILEKSDIGNKSYTAYYQISNKTILIKYILKNKTWYIITFEVPSGVNTKNYESVLNSFKAK